MNATSHGTPYGLRILTRLEERHSKPRDLIGAIARAPAGNLVLRVGQENALDEPGWHQTAHVVLTPEEARAFVDDVTTVMGWSA